jgi:hypothetical protein
MCDVLGVAWGGVMSFMPVILSELVLGLNCLSMESIGWFGGIGV